MKVRLLLAVSLLSFFSTVSLTASFADGTPEEAQKYTLRYQFHANTIVHFEVAVHSRIETHAKGSSEIARNNIKTQKHYRVIRAYQDGSADLELVLDTVYMEARFDDNPAVVLDSTDKEKQPSRYAHVLETVGKPLVRIRMSNRGEVGKVVKLSAKVSSQDKSLEFLEKLPEMPVAVNQEWKNNFELKVAMGKQQTTKIKMQRKYKLESVKEGVAKITFTTVPLTPIRDAKIKARIMQQVPQGSLLLDVKKGIILSRQSKVNQTVFDPVGPGSKMVAETHREEKLLRK